MPTDRDTKTVQAVEIHGGLVPATAARVLRQDMATDQLVAVLVADILASGTRREDRAEALCRLLGTYGLGSIVAGRIV